ncbi:FxSxx-COOH cyclophane-containing RiPP peptide [Streptomyces sp. NPDC007369]|uniref:FxSxx-COOH cyclophane-containing RiPP peptide n=1 Tax=Streptomyces sp. NPDC007369 TaxID=3154589 RepID=UPI0033D74679
MVIRHQTPHTEAAAHGAEGEAAPDAATGRESNRETDADRKPGREAGREAERGAERDAGAGSGPAPAACAARLPDLSGYDLAALRGIDHPVLARVIEGMVERVTHPAEILNAFDSGVS